MASIPTNMNDSIFGTENDDKIRTGGGEAPIRLLPAQGSIPFLVVPATTPSALALAAMLSMVARVPTPSNFLHLKQSRDRAATTQSSNFRWASTLLT